ncbi:MAG: MmcQ/YjbR family DNA-binding protein, partial [Clostridia bacterium]
MGFFHLPVFLRYNLFETSSSRLQVGLCCNAIPAGGRGDFVTRRELIDYCLGYPGAVEDYPFEDENSTVLRHATNRKWFALIFERDGKCCVNLKCDPMEADFLRRVFSSVAPAWHMNKVHWNTIA